METRSQDRHWVGALFLFVCSTVLLLSTCTFFCRYRYRFNCFITALDCNIYLNYTCMCMQVADTRVVMSRQFSILIIRCLSVVPPRRKPGLIKSFIADLHSGKLHREFHGQPEPVTKPVSASLSSVLVLVLPCTCGQYSSNWIPSLTCFATEHKTHAQFSKGSYGYFRVRRTDVYKTACACVRRFWVTHSHYELPRHDCTKCSTCITLPFCCLKQMVTSHGEFSTGKLELKDVTSRVHD